MRDTTPITLTYDGKTLSLRDWAAYLATVMEDPQTPRCCIPGITNAGRSRAS